MANAIERYFNVALYLLVLSGFVALASTGGLDLPAVILVGLALALRGFQLLTRREFVIPERWTTVLTLIYVAVYLADYFLLSRSFLTATVDLVLFAMVIRLFSCSGRATTICSRYFRFSWCWRPPCSLWAVYFCFLLRASCWLRSSL